MRGAEWQCTKREVKMVTTAANQILKVQYAFIAFGDIKILKNNLFFILLLLRVLYVHHMYHMYVVMYVMCVM